MTPRLHCLHMESNRYVRGWSLRVSIGMIVASSAPALAQADSDTSRLQRLADRYWDATMERHPTRATDIGDYRFNDRLEDVSEAGRERWKATLERFQLIRSALGAC